MFLFFYRFFIICLFSSSVFSSVSIEKYLREIPSQNYFSGLDGVDCVYVINLSSRLDKWNRTRLQLDKYGINPIRLEAVNGWLLSEEEKQELFENEIRLNGGRIGCLLSHLSAIKDAYDKGFEVIWVCEDDIKICEEPIQISNAIKTLFVIDKNWDVFYTDLATKNIYTGQRIDAVKQSFEFRPNFYPKNKKSFVKKFHVTKDILRIKQRLGAYSLLISRKGMKKILDHFNQQYLWCAYDIDIHFIPNIREYSFDRDCVTVDCDIKISDTSKYIDLKTLH